VGIAITDVSQELVAFIYSSETSVLTKSTRHHIPGDDILNSHRHENLKFCRLSLSFVLNGIRKLSHTGDVDRLCGLVVRVLGYISGGPGSIPGTTRKESSGSGTGSCLESREHGRMDPSRRPHGNLYPQKLAITSPTSGGRSVGVVRSRTQTTEFFFTGDMSVIRVCISHNKLPNYFRLNLVPRFCTNICRSEFIMILTVEYFLRNSYNFTLSEVYRLVTKVY
jgi:hypothetical protein